MKFFLGRFSSEHESFLETVRGTGELVDEQVLADPSTGAVVGDPPYPLTMANLAGYYIVDCESRERALELARMAAGTGTIEVRPLMDRAGLEM